MVTRHHDSTAINEQQRQRLVAWEMEYGHPLELDADLREAYEKLHQNEREKRVRGGDR